MRTVACLAVLTLGPLTNAITQEQPLQPGQRVRVTVPTHGIENQRATLDAIDGDMLVATADTTMQYPLADVTRLDRFAGRQGHPWRGAGIGALVGAAIGYGIYEAEGGDCLDPWSDATCIVLSGAAGGAAGAVLGALVGGLLWKTDKWEEVPLDQLRVRPMARRDGVGIGVSLRF